MRKKAIIRAINDLPNEVKIDDVIEQLIVLDKIESGLEDVKAGRLIDHETVKKRAKKWLK